MLPAEIFVSVYAGASLSSQLYLKSPERIGGVGVSVEEPGGLCPCTQQILCRQTLRL